MRVVFCLYGDSLLEEARMMVRSCKHFNYEVWQLTDTETPQIEGVDVVIRKERDVPQVLFRYRHLSELEGPYLSLDVDLFIARDVSGIEKPDYDAVMTVRGNNQGMIYNGGVFWINNNDFIRDCTTLIETYPPEWQDWTGGQRAMAEIGRTGNYRIKELPCSTWNFSPGSSEVDMNQDVRIYHYKGERRKQYMKDAFKHFYS